MYPVIEIHLRLGYVGAARRLGLAAFRYAFRRLHPRYQPAPPLSSILAGGEQTCPDRRLDSAGSATGRS